MPKANKKGTLWCLDFDHTLFDTDRFFHVDLRNKLLHLGISKEFDQTYGGVRKTGYSLRKHFKEIERANGPSKLMSKAEMVLDKSFKDLRRYLFSDAVSFLKMIKRDPQAKLFLVSRGNPDWQLNKINKSGLRKYFDRIFIVEKENDKSSILKKHTKKFDEVRFVDNNPLELDEIKKVYPKIMTFLINRVPPVRELKKLSKNSFLEAKKYSTIPPKRKHVRHQLLHDIVKKK